MNARQLLQGALQHQDTGRVPFDLGSTAVTGIHVRTLEGLRNYYGLEKRPVRVIEPYQMLGEITPDLIAVCGIDITGIWGENNMLGFSNLPPLKVVRTLWGQELLVPQKFSTRSDEKGDWLSYPDGDTSLPPSARMPDSGYFFDAIERQEPIDEESLDPADNLEEFEPVTETTVQHWKREAEAAAATGLGVVAAFGGTALGDIAFVPGMNLKHPKGIRSIAEWYMSIVMRPDYIHAVFEKQTEIALCNLGKIYSAVGDLIDVAFLCGTDFGTQDSTFCAPEQFDELWLPYYKRINDWIHTHTAWKTMKHSCGAVENFMGRFIDSGFDIINPVQVSAKGMNPMHLKKTYGDYLTFWGGGINTQTTLPYGTPAQVREEVLRHCEIFSKGGGFVFNTVHNIQANVPVENVVAMIDALKEFNK